MKKPSLIWIRSKINKVVWLCLLESKLSSDLILCLKNVKKGLYGKIYNRVDTQVILEFWRQYLEEKAKFNEAQYSEQKSRTWESRTEVDTMIIVSERKFESEKDKLQRVANAAKAEIRSLKEVIRNNDL